MKQIDNNKPQDVGQTIERVSKTQKRAVRNILNNAGTIVGIFIIFVVIVVFTTDIKLTGAMKWTELSLVFFILLFCSYSMYVNYANNGTRAGKSSETYIKAYNNYDSIKKVIIDNKYQARLPEFCRYYTKEELRNARTSILSEVAIDFEVYTKDYIGKDKTLLEQIETLSKSQIEAIIKANAVKPIKLSPEMIMKRGRGNSHRSPLGIKPETKKKIHLSAKFTTTAITSFVTGIIVLDVIINPTWATFAACCLKVLLVVLNGFMGYKMGYENIVVDTVEYMNDQVDLMNQLIQYIEANPEPINVKLDDEAAKEEEIKPIEGESAAVEEPQPESMVKLEKIEKEAEKEPIKIKKITNNIK